MSIKNALFGCVLAVPAVFAVPGLASAGQADHWYIAPELGVFSPDYRRGLEDQDWAYGLAFGRELNQYFNVELNLEGSRLSGRTGPRLQTTDAMVDLLGILYRNDTVAPYIRVGLGAIDNQLRGSPQKSDLGADTGVGAYINLWRSADQTQAFSLRPEIKVRWDNSGHYNYGDYIADIGFQYSFGGAPAEAAPPAPPPPPVVKPAPAPAPAPAPVAAPAPAAAPAPSIVPSSGSIILKGVTFAFNSARLNSSSDTVLDEVAGALKAHPQLRVQLQGYTDSVGSLKYNMRLSQHRAESVRQYLIGAGVGAGQLEARGFGPHDPIDTNRTALGRAHNRRVVLEVLSNPNAVKVKGQGTINKATIGQSLGN